MLSRLLGVVACDAELVSVRIPDVGAKVMLVILGPETRCALRCAAVRERHFVRLANGLSVVGGEGDHLTVSWIMRLAIVRVAYDEVRTAFARAVPAGPRTRRIGPSLLDADRLHNLVVEALSTWEVCDADEDVGEHGRPAQRRLCAA